MNLAALPIGGFSDGAAFDPIHKVALSSNGEGTLTVIKERDAQHFAVLGTVPTAVGARTIAIDTKTGDVFLPSAIVKSTAPPSKPGGRPHLTYAPGSFQLLIFHPIASALSTETH